MQTDSRTGFQGQMGVYCLERAFRPVCNSERPITTHHNPLRGLPLGFTRPFLGIDRCPSTPACSMCVPSRCPGFRGHRERRGRSSRRSALSLSASAPRRTTSARRLVLQMKIPFRHLQCSFLNCWQRQQNSPAAGACDVSYRVREFCSATIHHVRTPGAPRSSSPKKVHARGDRNAVVQGWQLYGGAGRRRGGRDKLTRTIQRDRRHKGVLILLPGSSQDRLYPTGPCDFATWRSKALQTRRLYRLHESCFSKARRRVSSVLQLSGPRAAVVFGRSVPFSPEGCTI
jgi:hypothetical protein